MILTYHRATGVLTTDDELVIGVGYSGNGAGKNNPSMSNTPNVGPIPSGDYTIGYPFDSPFHGPYAIPLTPNPNNQMFGRSGFLIHGDSIENPGCASQGCIVVERSVREHIISNGVVDLQVV